MRRPSALVLVSALAATALLTGTLAPVGAAGGAVQVGTLSGVAATNTCGALTGVQSSASGDGNPYMIPRDGVLTSWRWQTDDAAAGRRAGAVVLRPDGSSWTVVAKSALEPLQDRTTMVFTTRLQARAGDTLGLTVDVPAGSGSGTACWYGAPAGNTFRFSFVPAPAVGATFTATQPPLTSARISIAADLEPDADRDGYGDVTQDRCPAQATAGAACDRTPPQTTITSQPRSGRDRTVVVRFRSTEAGSTFRCSLDGAPLAACASPRGLVVRPVRHVFRVLATDRLGNVDRTPAVARWRVRRR